MMPVSDAREIDTMAPPPQARSQDMERRGFFVAIASVLVVIVAVGFAPSFYLKTYFHALGSGDRPIPMHVILHGVLLTSWYVLFLVQTILVASRRVAVHRLLGRVGAGVAVAVVTASMLVVVRLASRAVARGVPERVALIVTGDTCLLILFGLFVLAGISYRQRPDVHKRLMLLASITIVAPALARWPGAEALVPISVIVPQLGLIAALIVYDLVLRRRVHPATGWGAALYVVAAGASTAIGFSPVGRAFVTALA